MGKWLTLNEIIRDEIASELDIAEMVNDDKLTAYDKKQLKPIDWNYHIRQHIEILKLFKALESEGRISVSPAAERFSWDDLYRSFLAIFRHDIQKKPITNTADFARATKSFLFLKDSLTGNYKIFISQEQFDDIKERWGVTHVRDIIRDAVFNDIDVRKVFKESYTTQDEAVKSNKTPQKNKEEYGLLKVIGALIEIHYLQNAKLNLKKSSGNANLDAITKMFLSQLDDAGFTDNGIGDSHLRKDIFKKALEEISQNKKITRN